MILERAWGITEGTWTGAVPGGVVLRGPFNPCPGSAFATYLAPCLVLAHCHMLNTNADTDSGLDDPSSFHPGGANVLFADGSVHFLRNVLGDAGVNPDGSTRYTPSQPDPPGTRHAGRRRGRQLRLVLRADRMRKIRIAMRLTTATAMLLAFSRRSSRCRAAAARNAGRSWRAAGR